MTALATILGRKGRIDQRHLPASIFSFAQQVTPEVTPARVQDALGEIAVNHVADQQVFNSDAAERAYQRANQLVQVVTA